MRRAGSPQEGSPAFLRALAEQEGAAGTLRLGIAYDAGGRAVAAQFWLVEDGVATIHKLAHREDARAGSPGSLLSQAMFRAAIDDDRVDRDRLRPRRRTLQGRLDRRPPPGRGGSTPIVPPRLRGAPASRAKPQAGLPAAARLD